MFISTRQVITEYTRNSRLGCSHKYTRVKTVALFKCDNCNSEFERDIGKMDYRRLTSHVRHVCANCNPKKFAQAQGVESRRLWSMTVDSDIEINKL